MSVASQTFGLPMSRAMHHDGSVTAIGARLWLSLIAAVKARITAAAEARAERELLNLAHQYEVSMPAFAAELRAANARRR